MIEINLIEQKKSFKVPVILGVDPTKINYTFFIIALIAHYVPEMLINGQLNNQRKKIESEIKVYNSKFAVLKREMRPHRNLKKKLDAFNVQVEKLKMRSNQVDQIIKNKTNPKFLFEKVARNIPEDIWFNTLSIDAKNNITIKGGAISYKSIGDFILASNDTGFFGRTLNLTDSKTKEERQDGQKIRVQSYVIKGVIKSYDPWVQK